MTQTHTSTNRDQLIGYALDSQRALFHALQRGQAPAWLHLDLTMGQLKTLVTLSCEEGMNITALAERLAIGKPAASLLVDRLVQLGYAARTEDVDDRRRTLVELTSAGRDLVTQLRQGSEETIERVRRWMDTLSPEDLDALSRGMQALRAAAEHDEDATLQNVEA